MLLKAILDKLFKVIYDKIITPCFDSWAIRHSVIN